MKYSDMYSDISKVYHYHIHSCLLKRGILDIDIIKKEGGGIQTGLLVFF